MRSSICNKQILNTLTITLKKNYCRTWSNSNMVRQLIHQYVVMRNFPLNIRSYNWTSSFWRLVSNMMLYLNFCAFAYRFLTNLKRKLTGMLSVNFYNFKSTHINEIFIASIDKSRKSILQ